MGRTLDEARWQEGMVEILTGIKEWRLQHPTATLTEVERAIDSRWARLRRRIVEDLALASASADLREVAPEARPVCPQCGERLVAHGQAPRQVTVTHEQTVTLIRSYAHCPSCQRGFFPSG